MPTPKKKLPTGPIRIEPPLSKLPEVSTLQANEVQTNFSIQESTKSEGGKQDSTILDSSTEVETSFITSDDTLSQESTKPEDAKQDSTKKETSSAIGNDTLSQESTKPEGGKQDSTKEETSSFLNSNKIIEKAKQDSGSHEYSIIESSMIDSMKKENVLPESNFADDSGSSEAFISPSGTAMITEHNLQDSGNPESDLKETEYKKVAMRLSVEAVEKLQNFRAATGIPYEILVDVMIHNWENLPERTQLNYLQQAKQVRISRLMAGQEKTMKTMKAKYFPS